MRDANERRARGRDGPYARREDLGRPPCAQRGRRARPALYRPPPDPRGDQPAGLRRVARGQPQGAPPRPDHRHRGPQRADHRHHRPACPIRLPNPPLRSRQPLHRPGVTYAGRGAAQELRGVRHPPASHGRRGAGHRARHRPAARAHPAGPDHRLRRLAHLDPRRARRAGLRHRDQRGRARAGHPDAAPDPAQDDGHHRERRAARRGYAQGPDPGHHRQDRHRRRPGLRGRVPRSRGPRAVHGGPPDRLQHVHRGRRAGRAGRPGRRDVRLPGGPAARAVRRGLGAGPGLLAVAARRRRREPSTTR